MQRDTIAMAMLGLIAGVLAVISTCDLLDLLFMGLIAWGAVCFFNER
jgi:hypothetical protein